MITKTHFFALHGVVILLSIDYKESNDRMNNPIKRQFSTFNFSL